nr:unnamed protein product [Callosobruchus analis]
MGSSKTCQLCQKNISKTKIKLNCGVCNCFYHYECADLTEIEARLMIAEKTPWKCEECRRDIATKRYSQSFENISNNDLKSMIKELQSDMKELRRSVEFISEKYEEEKKRNKVVSDMLVEITKDNETLKQEVNRLKNVLQVRENDKIKNNITFTGLINKEEEKVTTNEKLNTVFNSLNVTVTPEDIAEVSHIKTLKGIKVVVSLNNLEKKRQILKARSAKGKITSRNCGLGDSTTPIYVDEELTKETYVLFKKAKQLLREKGYKYVWHREGRILARKADGNNVIWFLRADRGSRGGGVGAYVRSGLQVKIIEIEETTEKLEQIWFSLKINQINISCGILYRPPASNEVVIMGDLNIDLCKINNYTDLFNSTLETFDLNQIVIEPTRCCGKSSSLLDVIALTNIDALLGPVTHDDLHEVTDHQLTYCALKINLPITPSKLISYRDFNSFHAIDFDMPQVDSRTIENYRRDRCCDAEFAFHSITDDDVVSAISRVKSNAAGPDGLTLEMVKLCCPVIVPFLTHIYNESIRTSKFPSDWKRAFVLPLPKVSLPQNESELRPISLLCVLSKIFEKAIS